MPLFDSYSREQLRQTYADAWRKAGARAPLAPLESMIADVIGMHPEYQAIVEDANAAEAYEPGSADAGENPFLHMGLHLAVREQAAIDLPPGVRELLRSLQARHGDLHRAEHELMEALAETLWRAQRDGGPPDVGAYMSLARRRLEG